MLFLLAGNYQFSRQKATYVKVAAAEVSHFNEVRLQCHKINFRKVTKISRLPFAHGVDSGLSTQRLTQTKKNIPEILCQCNH